MPVEGNFWSYGNLSQETASGYQDNNQSESNTSDFSENNREILNTEPENIVIEENKQKISGLLLTITSRRHRGKELRKSTKQTLYTLKVDMKTYRMNN
jgi:hypothetical protein